MLGLISKQLLKCSSVNQAFAHHRSFKITLFKSEAFLSSAAIDGSNCRRGDAFTASYLVSSCGVTVAAAKRMSAQLHRMKSTDKPERVLKFFRSCGFNDAQISRMVRRQPLLLLADPDKTLKPKFDALTSVGASHAAVVNLISKCPGLWTRSIKNGILPMFDLLKSSVGSSQDTFDFLTRYGALWLASANTLGANLVVLREIGMPDPSIAKFIKTNAYSMMTTPERFKAVADKAVAMGFDMQKYSFGDALRSFIAITEDNWNRKAESFKKWGWSDSEFLMAFKKQPKIMLVSEKKIEEIMNLLVNGMGVEAPAVARLPYVLLYSLEKRIVPRCSVIQRLLSKCLMEKKDCNVLYDLMMSEKQFLESYLKKHEEILTELVDVVSMKSVGKSLES
uniref:Uncharacterized protein n=1 Tax=Kalanchoe fedtschenkoi TaxID=63787 RepID=A0A7N0TUM5_KALFE